MRLIRFWIALILTAGLIFLLDIQLPSGGSKTPRLGMFLSPQKGFWQNAESVNFVYNENIKLDGLKGATEVYFDERLVPHVYAENDLDAFYVQGFLHAKFRLWQMEFQTHAAGGRLSEILGPKSGETDFLGIDVFFRRLGMVYAAEESEKELAKDAETKQVMDAYTAGVNAFIKQLRPEQYPLEYKLLNYKPEAWSNLKTLLFLKYMSFDLAGHEEDFEHTKAMELFSKEEFNQLYPYGSDSLDPIFPGKNLIASAGFKFRTPEAVDSQYFQFSKLIEADTTIVPDKDNGSNNWAVAGSKTASGRPILCNDPHLGLNLPSLWYEIQLSTPNFNSYGVSFPGAPAVIIGFNDNAAWGFTNAMRDVRDYYEIEFKDSSKQNYLYNDHWFKTNFRNEVIKRKGMPDTTIVLPMTVWGPVMFDDSHPDKNGTGKAWACRWKAHDAGVELKTFIGLDKAKDVSDYVTAIAHFKTPGQNMIFATKSGDIALKQQGEFPAKWYRQGDFLMPGKNDEYAWQGNVPDMDNYLMLNPERGFVSSGNQLPYDTTYPYYLGGSYPPFRGYLINRYLSEMQAVTPTDMMDLQKNNFNVVAEWARPKMLELIKKDNLSDSQKRYLDLFAEWNLRNEKSEKGATVFKCWWDSLSREVFADELSEPGLPWPETSTLLDALLRNTEYVFVDNINTENAFEEWGDVLTASFQKAAKTIAALEKDDNLSWGKYKNSGIRHLLRLEALSRLHLNSNGGENMINALKQYHGPSWKMVVELTDETEAYGIYPGGQSGNPGSKFYDSFITDFIDGKYYKLEITPKDNMTKKKHLGKIVFQPA